MVNKEQIQQLAAGSRDDLVGYRRHLHAHPELAFEEHQTAAFVTEQLDKFGIPYQKGVAKTGVVALLKGKNPDKKVIALRGDMDALPIEEANDVPYKSQVAGRMHACGHDVHTSCVLGAAGILSQLKDEFEGTIKFIFQPSEEKLPGGASVMIQEDVLKNPEPAYIFGQHVLPELEVGKVGFRPGMYMASADEIYVTVKGKGGHAALPHLCVDPVLISSHIIVALQQLISRNSNPFTPNSLSFGKIAGNGATNIIPDEVRFEGTFRTMNEEWRMAAHDKMRTMAEGIALSMGGSCDFNIVKGYPCVVNDEALTMRAREDAIEYLGQDKVIDLPMRMTAEDFAYYSQVMPGCFYRLGVRNELKGITSGLHTPTFDVDEDSLETGAGLMAWLAVKELQR